jgi:hypothetical protein
VTEGETGSATKDEETKPLSVKGTIMSAGLAIFTLFHVATSLVGIASGFVAVWGMTKNRERNGWTVVLLSTTVLTSVTGFLFLFHRFLLLHAVGIVSVIVLPIAIYALYMHRLAGAWNLPYSITALSARYLNVFVLIAQLFAKVPCSKQWPLPRPRRHSTSRSLACS